MEVFSRCRSFYPTVGGVGGFIERACLDLFLVCENCTFANHPPCTSGERGA